MPNPKYADYKPTFATLDECSRLPASQLVMRADARHVPLRSASVDLVITSPPYWRKRRYHDSPLEIGQEPSLQEYIQQLINSLENWRSALSPTASVFIVIGDTYVHRCLAGVPFAFEAAARQHKWIVRNRIIWVKPNTTPQSARNRLTNKHEYILHLTINPNYYYDVVGYAAHCASWGNPGDVWTIQPSRNTTPHLAPFPEELVERIAVLACPPAVCTACATPITRVIQRGTTLNLNRPQARRALQLMREHNLTADHLAAIRAVGISDAGKAMHFQKGAGRNHDKIQALAQEAKQALGGYFREFTFAQPETVGWRKCTCDAPLRAGTILDPFVGTGTTLHVAQRLGLNAIGLDLNPLIC